MNSRKTSKLFIVPSQKHFFVYLCLIFYRFLIITRYAATMPMIVPNTMARIAVPHVPRSVPFEVDNGVWVADGPLALAVMLAVRIVPLPAL